MLEKSGEHGATGGVGDIDHQNSFSCHASFSYMGLEMDKELFKL